MDNKPKLFVYLYQQPGIWKDLPNGRDALHNQGKYMSQFPLYGFVHVNKDSSPKMETVRVLLQKRDLQTPHLAP